MTYLGVKSGAKELAEHHQRGNDHGYSTKHKFIAGKFRRIHQRALLVLFGQLVQSLNVFDHVGAIIGRDRCRRLGNLVQGLPKYYIGATSILIVPRR